MSKQQLYEFAVIYTPIRTKDQVESGEQAQSKLVVDVTRCIAASEGEATMLASRAIPAEYATKLAQCEIAVRPF